MTYGLIPDGTNWVDAYGRVWTAHGDDLVLWADPVVTLLGDNPQKILEGMAWVDAGATAVDIQGTDLTGSIVVDSSALDPDTQGTYPVTYTVTDSEGATDTATREVIVIDVHRPEVREVTYQALDDGMPDGIYVYETSAEQVKLPAVIIGTMEWVPARMNSLETLRWTMQIVCATNRGMPLYGQHSLETLGKKTASLLVADGFIVSGYTEEGTSDIGGVEAMTATVTVDYLSSEMETH